MARRISVAEKKEIIRFHRIQVYRDPLHRQTDTIKFFKHRFNITKSSLNRWLIEDSKHRKVINKRVEVPSSSESQDSEEFEALNNPHSLRDEVLSTDKQSDNINLNNTNTIQANLLDMVISSIIQYYVFLKMNLDKVSYTTGLAASVIEKFKQIYPTISDLPQDTPYKLKRDDISYINSIIEDQAQIKQIFNTLGKEHSRVEKTFKPYDKDNIYQFNEFTINLNDYLNDMPSYTTTKDTENTKEYIITVGIGFNFLTKEFLTPIVITNFKPSYLNMLKTNTFFFVNGTGYISMYIFKKYVEWLNKKFQQEYKKVLLIMDKSCSHYFTLSFSNIKFYYNHMNNFPYNYGIGHSIINEVSLQISNYLSQTKKTGRHVANGVPSVIFSALNNIITSFTTPSNYNLFLSHCVDLSMTSNIGTSISKMLKANINLQHVHYSNTEKCLVLNSQEEQTKSWMQKLKVKPQPNVKNKETLITSASGSNSTSDQDQLEHIIKSNIIFHNCKFGIKSSKSEDSTTIELDKLLKLRSKLSCQVSSETLTLYDQVFVSIAQDLLGVTKQSHTWKPFSIVNKDTSKADYDYDSEYEFEFEAGNPTASGANLIAYDEPKIKQNNQMEIDIKNPQVKNQSSNSISDIENLLEGIKEQVHQELTDNAPLQHTPPKPFQKLQSSMHTTDHSAILVGSSSSNISVFNRAPKLSHDLDSIQTSQVKQIFSDSESDSDEDEYFNTESASSN